MNSVITFGKYANVVFGFFLPKVIAQCREIFQNVSVDRTRIKPIVKITGEFWAQTTEGDGNYRMFQFLEQEGAHILPEPITTWLLYMLHQVTQSLRDRKYLDIPFKRNNPESLVLTIRSWYRYRKSNIRMSLAEILIKRQYNLLRRVMRDLPQSLGNQYELQEIAHPYFNSRIEGGEGHLEIAKNIKSNVGSISHMVLSVKPFGCMPSTQSDGVQSAVTSHFKDMIFLPIETSGEGELNAKSRVQMALNEARANAKTECAEVLKEYRMTYTDFQHHVRSNENLQNPFLSFPKQDDTVGIAANFATFVSSQMKMNRKDRGK